MNNTMFSEYVLRLRVILFLFLKEMTFPNSSELDDDYIIFEHVFDEPAFHVTFTFRNTAMFSIGVSTVTALSVLKLRSWSELPQRTDMILQFSSCYLDVHKI